MPHTCVGAFLGVLSGTGAGTYARVVAGQNRTWQLDTPLPALDATSMISIVPFRGHMIFADNRFEDGGAFQLYAMSINCVVAENVGTRMDGFSAWVGGFLCSPFCFPLAFSSLFINLLTFFGTTGPQPTWLGLAAVMAEPVF